MTTATLKSGSNSWTLRLFTLLVWAAIGLCTAYWMFKFVTTEAIDAISTTTTSSVVVDTKAVAKLLGATNGSTEKLVDTTRVDVKLSLFGLAASPGGQGFALIAEADKPARPYRIGAKVTDDLVLKSISKTNAILAASMSAPDGLKLELPIRKPGTLVATTNMAQPPSAQPIPSVANAANASTTNATAAANAPLYANTIGTLNPVLAESLRPTSRFAPRTPAPGTAVNASPNAVSPIAATATSSAVVPQQ
jgi:general secretion pathway protein C